ncbi:MAG: class I SAM-dependent methyltransferase family protein [Natronomonas sp.]
MVRCVRVPRSGGETARQVLSERDLLSETHDIEATEDAVYIPLSGSGDAETVRSLLESSLDGNDRSTIQIEDRDLPRRETQTLPADSLGFEPTYERLGRIAIIDEDDPERAREVATAIAESDLPVDTVVNRASKVKGEMRIRDWDVLVGETTETVHREYGNSFELDIAAVYFSPRLATDRRRVVESVDADEQVFDMFAGVGPFVIPAAKRAAAVVGVDINPTAIEYLRRNAERNGVTDRVTAICGDVSAVSGYDDWADRIVMNLPHSAEEFLDTAVELAAEEAVIHYYDIAGDDEPFAPGEAAIRGAANAGGYDVEIETRRVVRSYAPHELNVRLDARLRRR